MFLRVIASCLVLASCAGEIDDDQKAGDNLVELTADDDTGDFDGGGEPRARVCAEGAVTKGIDVS